MLCKYPDLPWRLEKTTWVKVAAEFIGTGTLLFIGCMSTITTVTGQSPSNHAAWTFGLIVNGIIMMIGHLSSAHINPAVTLSAILVGYVSVLTGLTMIIAQISGAIVGYGILKGVMANEYMNMSADGICMTLVDPQLSTLQGLVVEIICTFILTLVNFSAWDKRNWGNSDSTPLRVGLVVAALSMAAGPYTGCSMNPARSLAPAAWNNNWTKHWIYWIGPFLGAAIGACLYRLIFAEKSTEKEDTRCEPACDDVSSDTKRDACREATRSAVK